MSASTSQWEETYLRVPLCHIPREFAGIGGSPYLLEYLKQVLLLCPRGGSTLEVGVGRGFGATWLSLRGIKAEGIDTSPGLVERARQVCGILGGSARFCTLDMFSLAEDPEGGTRDVIHHQGLLEHYAVPQIRAALARQVACARWVVFSVPSVYYPFEPEIGDERLLPMEEWARILEPFRVDQLRYYGDPQHGAREHVIAVLQGQEPDDALRAMMTVPEEPYPDGISAIVHTRNEAGNIADCIRSLQGWTDEIIVCDMESTDETVKIARVFTDKVMSHPLIANFDRARNVSALRARYRWILYVDADERIPAGLSAELRGFVDRGGEGVSAMVLPFRNYFSGHWMQCLYPGYTAPRLLRNGQFRFNARLHSGAQVNGPVVLFPANRPELAVEHRSYEGVTHYLDKMNRYTTGEAENQDRDGIPFHWQTAIARFVEDFEGYYRMGAARDEVYGFIYSFFSGFYRFAQYAKLFERRERSGRLTPGETAVPASLEEMLSFALEVARRKPRPQAPTIRVADGPGSAEVVVRGPLHSPSGYGDSSRNLLFALQDAGAAVGAVPVPWGDTEAPLPANERDRLQAMEARPARHGFVQIIEDFPAGFISHPDALATVGRTVFETDRLPQDRVDACNRMDRVWVPTEFNRRTFAASGVDEAKLVVVPECFDPAAFEADMPKARAVGRALLGVPEATFVFLSVFDWTLHKGWDVLLCAFLEAFEGRDDVLLALKAWSTMGYSPEQIREQAAGLAREELGHDLLADRRVRFIQQWLGPAELLELNAAADAYVMPSRGEGWGRPFMDAMACGVPAIGTGWGGSTAFMTPENSYLVACRVVPVPERGWREIPTYRGHRWAEPDGEHLKEILIRVVGNREEAREVGARGRRDVTERFSRAAVGALTLAEIRRMREEISCGGVGVWRCGGPEEPCGSVEVRECGSPEAPGPTAASEEAKTAKNDADRQSGERTEEPGGTSAGEAAGGQTPTPTHSHTPTPPYSQTPILPHSDAPLRLRWEGAFFNHHSLAHVNREFCLRLAGSDRADLSLSPVEPYEYDPQGDHRAKALLDRVFAPLGGPADVHVRHFFPPRLDPPTDGRLVLMQPWEYGYLPEDWVGPIRDNVDEVWCNSGYVRDVYLASGIPAEKLHLLPLGVDTKVFNPDAPPFVFSDSICVEAQDEPAPTRPHLHTSTHPHLDTPTPPYRFLYVGGTIDRKGFSILLEAFLKGFSAYDDVCLVVKDTGTRTVYRGDNQRERVMQLAADPSRPRIVYLDDDLPPHVLAGVYTACDCLVAPYRGEGFCLPPLEAMACGLPVIVTAGGPTDDFVDESVGWRVPAERKPFGDGRIGQWQCAGPTWMFEVSPAELARAMRHAYCSREEAAARGQAGAERVAANWTWDHSVEKVLARAEEIRSGEARVGVRRYGSVGVLADGSDRGDGPNRKERRAAAAATRKRGASEKAGSSHAAQSDGHGRTRTGTDGHGPDTAIHPHSHTPTLRPIGQVQGPPLQSPSLTPIGPRQQPSISLCMIVRDEERCLEECLESAKPWVDEIVLVDTGSSDRTMEIAKARGCKVSEFAWRDDFSAARNESLERATGDWILWMDADDTLPALCGSRLRDLVFLAEDRTTVFIVQVHVPPGPGDIGFTVVDHVKLFRNLPILRFEGRIHEQILEPINRIGGTILRTDLHVVHSGYDHSPEGQRRKRERDTRILDKDLEERPDHPFVHFNLGMTYFHLKEYDKALGFLERSVALSKPRDSTVRKLYAMMAGCHMGRNDLAAARAAVEKGLSLYPRDPEMLFRAGGIFHALGDLAAAEQYYLRLIGARETGHIDSIDVSMTSYKAYHNLGLVYRGMGRLADAEAQWRRAVADSPAFAPSWEALRDLYRGTGRQGEGETG